MVYNREQLLSAVREAGRDGQPFTLGAVRQQLGLKTRDKREIKRFRSRFRECCTVLGSNVEKLGPSTYRLKNARSVGRPDAHRTDAAEIAARLLQVDRGVRPDPSSKGIEPLSAHATQELRAMQAAAESTHGLGSRLSAFIARMRGRKTAATALSRLTLDLQPARAHHER